MIAHQTALWEGALLRASARAVLSRCALVFVLKFGIQGVVFVGGRRHVSTLWSALGDIWHVIFTDGLYFVSVYVINSKAVCTNEGGLVLVLGPLEAGLV